MMKALVSAAALAASLGLAGAAWAQPAPIYGPNGPVPAPMMTAPSTMQDDGSSSDYPVPMPGDKSGDALNSQYQGGISVPIPQGFPAPYRVR